MAVLERDASALATRVQAGDKAARPGLLKLTEQGFTFVGRAYLRGLRKAEADRLVDEAKVAQKSLPPKPLQQLSAGCQAEAHGCLPTPTRWSVPWSPTGPKPAWSHFWLPQKLR